MSFISLPLILMVLLVLGITILAVKAGAIALRVTGLDPERADFQALSAVTGTGFTTREAELIVADPRRRRIIAVLMILGNVVLVVIIGLLIGSFTTLESKPWMLLQGVILLAGTYLLYRLFIVRRLSPRMADWLERKIEQRLRVRERGVHEVLNLAQGYGVAELRVLEGSPIEGQTLAEAGLRKAGLLVLAIRRRDDVIPSPVAMDRIEPDDRLVCYGELERMHAFAKPSEEDEPGDVDVSPPPSPQQG